MPANRKRVIPQIRNPELELSLVRDIDISTNESRDEVVKTTAGEPMVIPLVNALEAGFYAVHPDLHQAAGFPVDDSISIWGAPDRIAEYIAERFLLAYVLRSTTDDYSQFAFPIKLAGDSLVVLDGVSRSDHAGRRLRKDHGLRRSLNGGVQRPHSSIAE